VGFYGMESSFALTEEFAFGSKYSWRLKEEFKARMALESVTVEADGSFQFWYGDGDLFWGHSIQVSGNLAEGPTDASLAG
jgi:hypothetical protein